MAEREQRAGEKSPALSLGPSALAIFLGVGAARRLAWSGEGRPLKAIELAEKLKAEGASPTDIHRQTSALLKGTPYAGVHFGAEGKPRFEIDDSTARVRDNKAIPVGGSARMRSFFDHPELYRAMPQLADLRVAKSPVGGSSYSQGNKIGIEAALFGLPDGGRETFHGGKSSILHELQHPVQDIEGHAPGSSPNAPEIVRAYPDDRRMRHKTYERVAGEVEARMTQARMHMAAAERRAHMPEPDVDWKHQIVPKGMLKNQRRDMAPPPEGKPMANDDIASRLKGLKKAQLQAIAKDVGALTRGTNDQLRRVISQQVVQSAHAANKGAIAGQVRPWAELGPNVDYSKVSQATSAARGAAEARVHAAIDKVAGPASSNSPATFKEKIVRDHMATGLDRKAAVKAANATIKQAFDASRGKAEWPKPTGSTPRVARVDVQAIAARVNAALNSGDVPELRQAKAEIQSTRFSKTDAHALFAAVRPDAPPLKKGATGKAAVARVMHQVESLVTFRHKQLAHAAEAKQPAPGWSDAARAASAEARGAAAPGTAKPTTSATPPPTAVAPAPPAPAGPSIVSRAAGFIWRNQGPIALGVAGVHAKVAYDRAWSENKTRKEALVEAGKVAAPTVGAVAAPYIGKAAGAIGDVALDIAKAGLHFSGTSEGLLMNAVSGGTPLALTAGAGAVGVAGKVLQGAGWLAGKLALPIALGMVGYDMFRGYKEGGASGAAVEGAKSTVAAVSFGAVPLLNEAARKYLLPNGGNNSGVGAPRWGVPTGRAYLNAAAERKAQTNVVTMGAKRREAAAPQPSSNGWVQDYTRKDGTRVTGYKRAA